MSINTKSSLLVVVLMIAAASHAMAADMPVKAPPPSTAPPPFFIVNDNTIGYYYAPTATNPGAGKTPKNVLTFTHFDVWEYGTHFFNVEWLKATNGKAPVFGTPAAPCDQNGPLDPPGSERCPGYTEIYGFLRSTLGWNQIFRTKAFSFGPLTNIEFAAGVDANTDNTTLGSAKRSIQGGLQFDFSAPYKGFLNVGLFAYKEWQHDGFASTFPFETIPNPSGNVDFNPTWAVEVNYAQPLGILPPSVPLTYKALVVIHGPKGCGETCAPLGPGLLRTTEYLTQQSLHLDVGKMLWDQPNRLSVWAGYRWWKNKFGIQPIQPNGEAVDDPNRPATDIFQYTTESTWLVGSTLTF
jgi:hypothetical protein